MRVGIVGAGIAGLGAAYTLAENNIDSVVFEKNDFIGGRCSTRECEGFRFDQGATAIAPRGKALETVMLSKLDTSQLVKIELPIFVHDSLRISGGDPGKNKIDRFTYQSGNGQLAHLLAEKLDVRSGQLVESLEKKLNNGFRICNEEFDAVILTPPVDHCQALLASIGEFRPINNIRYRRCLSVMLGYKLPTPETKYHALIDVEQRHPLTWMCIESRKCTGRAPEGCTAIVAQMSPQFSAMHFESDEKKIVEATALYIERLFGKEWAVPHVSDVKRWRWSQPEMTAMFDSVNSARSNLLIAGDGLMGGRVEFAYESGYKAAMMLVGR